MNTGISSISEVALAHLMEEDLDHLMVEVLVILLPLLTQHLLLYLEVRPEGIELQQHLVLGGLEAVDQDSKVEVSFLLRLKG